MNPFTNKNSITSFRHRGTMCSVCGNTVMVFGQDAMPPLCPNCNSTLVGTLLWDHQVTTKTTVVDLLHPVPTPSPVDGTVTP